MSAFVKTEAGKPPNRQPGMAALHENAASDVRARLATGRAPLFRRYLKFCVVGGTGMVVDMGILYVLASPSMVGWNLTVSKVVAAEVAIFNNFLWNEVWTFKDLSGGANSWKGRWVRFGKFNLICVAGIGISVLLLNAEVHWLGMNMLVANFVAIVGASFWNFGVNLKLAWQQTPEAGMMANGRRESR
jgi:putative flippase GtrA